MYDMILKHLLQITLLINFPNQHLGHHARKDTFFRHQTAKRSINLNEVIIYHEQINNPTQF